MALREYDHHEATLGDILRAARASLGRSLIDAERALHIKASLLQAIETGDLAAFPNQPMISGYVRSYARYLELDPDRVLARFRAETGFQAPNAALGRGGARKRSSAPFGDSRFAPTPAQTRFALRVPLGSIVSALALVGLVAGLGYGGYALLQNIQRVGFAPLPEAPEVVAEAPRFAAIERAMAAARPDAAVYAENGALAAVYAPDDRPPIQRRDGPISEIDPSGYGVFAGTALPAPPRANEAPPETVQAPSPDATSDTAVVLAAGEPLAGLPDAAPRALSPAQAEPSLAEVLGAATPKGIAIHVVNEAWIRVRNADRAIVFEGLLAPGTTYDLPARVQRGLLRAGNAGDVYVVIDGAAFGPVGRPGSVVKNISLAKEDVRETYTVADVALPGAPEDDIALTATAARD
ncbi:MAG: RodZ domain-containing protein [Pseudomonadota bacterium]